VPIQSSLSQGLALLESAVGRERSGRTGHTASRLAEATGIERSRVSRLTRELRSMQYLERDDAQVLRAGERFLAVAAALNEPLLRPARAELRGLAAHFGVTARITGRDGVRAVLLRYETGVGAAEASVRPGLVTPTWSTGAGRALLWDHDRAQLETLLSAVQFVGVGGPGGARSVAEVHELMRRDRERGIVWAAEEFDEGIHEAALPIRGTDGGVIAAISASGRPVDRDRAAEITAALTRAAERLTSLATGR
jgi:DNA-binding IclR family transcriptional regulator